MQNKYEIKKETHINGNVFLSIYLNGNYTSGTTKLIENEEEEEKKAIEILKSYIETHKKTGEFKKIETIYTEET